MALFWSRPSQSSAPAAAEPEAQHVEDPVEVYRPWRVTKYYVSDEKAHDADAKTIDVLTPESAVLATVSPDFFASMALEGTGLLVDGRLLNVTSTWLKVRAEAYDDVWQYHKKHLSHRPPGYSGLVVKDDKVVEVLAFSQVPVSSAGKGFGRVHGIDMDPWRTVAADIGTAKRAEPRYKGMGGLVPIGTRAKIRELVGKLLPDGTTHDGWVTVNDSGGGIFGAHFDLFIGVESDEHAVSLPDTCHVTFEGIEEKVPEGYDYGLHDG